MAEKKDVSPFEEWMIERFDPEWDGEYSRSDLQEAWNAAQSRLITRIIKAITVGLGL